MNENDRDRLLAELLDRPQDRDAILGSAHISPEDRAEIVNLVRVADDVWLSGQAAPPLAEDPIAALLGLVPDPERQLDPKALSRARKSAKMSVSEVVRRLRNRGWDFSDGDVYRWETSGASDVPPAVVQALGEVFSIDSSRLISRRQPSLELDEVRQDKLFDQLIERWAAIQHVSHVVAAGMLESRLLQTVHRGERPDPQQLLQSLETLVSSFEETKNQ